MTSQALHGQRFVALGGGHGLSATLAALRLLGDDVTAIVTVADDGGSSGRLRTEFPGTLPPGDLRMALSALCDDTSWGHLWRDVLQHRFEGEGELRGHAVGNLIILALWELLGDTVAGLDTVGRLLGARGRVLPMAGEALDIVAEIRGHDQDDPDAVVLVRGQHRVASSPGRVESIGVVPTCPKPCEPTLTAVAQADWVVIGPGSWFTSVVPHLLVPDLADALATTRARKILVLNLDIEAAETRGFTAVDHLSSFAANAPDIRLDVVIADPAALDDEDVVARACARIGAQLAVVPLGQRGRPGVHDTLRLAAALRDVMGE